MTHIVLFVLGGHGEWFVGQLILTCLLGFNNKGDRTGPVLALDNGLELPVLVGAVRDGDHLDVFATHVGGEVLNFLHGWNACAAPSQGQGHWLVWPTIQEAAKFLSEICVY